MQDKTAELCENINFRHTMAQRASRASNDLYCHIILANKTIDAEGYILRTRRNAVTVLVPRFVPLPVHHSYAGVRLLRLLPIVSVVVSIQ